MFEIDQQKYQYYQYGMASFSDCITAFKGEQTLTSGIMNVTDSNPKTVGHSGDQQRLSHLRTDQFQCRPQHLRILCYGKSAGRKRL